MEEKILSILVTIQSDMSLIRQDINVLRQDVNVLRKDVNELKQGQEEIWDVIRVMADEMVTKKEFYAELKPLKEDVITLKSLVLAPWPAA